MENNITKQIFDTLNKANKVLIALPEKTTADALASALALRLFLQKMGKDAGVAYSGILPENLGFLPSVSQIKSDISGGKSLVLVVNTSVKKLEELSYQTEADKVNIYLKSKDGNFTEADISFAQDKFPLDAIIALGGKSLESFGQLFERHADLFFETPKINIDNKPGNEYFGAINLVDINATSLAEMLTLMLGQYEQQLIDEDIATCLLTGIITQTHSFQHVQTTPQSFLRASELVALGGRQQEVVKNLYKTKSLSLLKLWGRALARLKVLEAGRAVYSVLNLLDFEKAGSSAEDLPLVLLEFLNSMESFKIVSLVAEVPGGGIRVLSAVHSQLKTEDFLSAFGQGVVSDLNSGLYKMIDVSLEGVSLAEAENKLLSAINNPS